MTRRLQQNTFWSYRSKQCNCCRSTDCRPQSRRSSSGSLAMLAAMRLAAGLHGETPAAIIDIVFAGCGRADGVRSCAVRVPIYKICGHPYFLGVGSGSFRISGRVCLFLEVSCSPPRLPHGRKIQVGLPRANLIRSTQMRHKSRFNGVMPAPRTDPAHLYVVEQEEGEDQPHESVGYLFGNITSQRRRCGTGGRHFL